VVIEQINASETLPEQDAQSHNLPEHVSKTLPMQAAQSQLVPEPIPDADMPKL
ncbi:hypothetical protein A2U01_0102335, partial [Trifolium medium]|nr:hypothetical protein [Trifolium medium]